MNINIDPKDLESLVSEAILRSLDQEKRDILIKDAIQHLIAPQRNGYGQGQGSSPLQQAFREAVAVVARQECEKALAGDPEVASKIRGLITEAIARVLSSDRREQVVSDMAMNLTSWMTRDR